MHWLTRLDDRYFCDNRLERIDEYHAFVNDFTHNKKTYLAFNPNNVDKPTFLNDRKLAIGHLAVQQMLLHQMQHNPQDYAKCRSSAAEAIRNYQEHWIQTHNREFGYLLSVRERLPEIKQRDELIMRRLFGNRSWL